MDNKYLANLNSTASRETPRTFTVLLREGRRTQGLLHAADSSGLLKRFSTGSTMFTFKRFETSGRSWTHGVSCPSGDLCCRSIMLPMGLSVTGTDCFLQSRLLSGSFVMGFWTTLNDQSAERQDHFHHCIQNLSHTHTHTRSI